MQTQRERESTRGDVSHTLRDFFCKQNDLPAGGEAEHLTCIFFFAQLLLSLKGRASERATISRRGRASRSQTVSGMTLRTPPLLWRWCCCCGYRPCYWITEWPRSISLCWCVRLLPCSQWLVSLCLSPTQHSYLALHYIVSLLLCC